VRINLNSENGNGFHILEFKTEPKPTIDPPSLDELKSMLIDGVCPHGYKSWLLILGFI